MAEQDALQVDYDRVKAALAHHLQPGRPLYASVVALMEKYENALRRNRELEALLDREARWAAHYCERWQEIRNKYETGGDYAA